MKKSEELVKAKLEADGWEVYHRGIPDLICFKDNKFKFVEVKSYGNDSRTQNPSSFQLKVIDKMRKAGIEVNIYLLPQRELTR